MGRGVSEWKEREGKVWGGGGGGGENDEAIELNVRRKHRRSALRFARGNNAARVYVEQGK